MRQRLAPNDPCWCGSGKKYKKCHQARDLLKELQGQEPGPVLPPGFVPVRSGTIAPLQIIPSHIVRPDYAITGKPVGARNKNLIKSADTIARMRLACQAARRVLDKLKAEVRPGITTDALDKLANRFYVEEGGYPSTLNYHQFPKSICTSVNEVICHGIPDSRPLVEGDIVNLDVTIYLHGVHGDCSESVGVGTIDAGSQQLIDFTRRCMWVGIAAVRPGGMIRDIGKAIEGLATTQGYGVVRAFVGHGIGELFHQDPQVPHYYDPAATFEIKPGMTFTVEPMINQGTWKHTSWDDNWTAVTADLKRSAQHEHTILVTETGVEVLTLAPDEVPPVPLS